MTESAIPELDLRHAELLFSRINWVDISLMIIALCIVVFVSKLVGYAANIISKRHPTDRMKILGWIPLLRFAIYFAGLFIAVYFFIGPSQDTLFAIIASGLLAAGFALKDIVASIIYGIVILIDKPFQVGDRINFRNIYGDVTAIGLNNVTVITLDNEIISIPNHLFIDDLVGTNNLGTAVMTCVVNIHLSPRANLEQAISILDKLTKASPLIQLPYSGDISVMEILSTTGMVTIQIQTKCDIQDARYEEDFRTYIVVEANKAFKVTQIIETNEH